MPEKKLGPVVMILLDGWGITLNNEANAITKARTPVFDNLITTYPTTVLKTHGMEIGDYFNEKPDIRSGYFCLGTGKRDDNILFRINNAIDNNHFFKNKTLLKAVDHTKYNNSKLHLIGLASEANIHSSFNHLQSLIKLAANNNIENLYLHLILDGVDSAPDSGIKFIEEVEKYIHKYQKGKIATISGRFYGMDRDNHWTRTSKFYNAIIRGEGRQTLSQQEAIKESYNKHIFDKELYPTVIVNREKHPLATIRENDSVIFFNIRGDRLKQIAKALTLPQWDKVNDHKYLKNTYFASLSLIDNNLPIETAFPRQEENNSLSSILGGNKIKQLKISGSEKFGLLTYYFNGCQHKPFNNESREIFSENLQKKEEINKQAISRLINAIKTENYGFILANFINLDRAATKYDIQEITKIIEALDSYFKKIITEIKNKNAVLIISSPFGKVEELYDLHTGNPSLENTYNNTPLIIAGNSFEGIAITEEVSVNELNLISPEFSLIDVAPTILKIMGIPIPKEMQGKSIL